MPAPLQQRLQSLQSIHSLTATQGLDQRTIELQQSSSTSPAADSNNPEEWLKKWLQEDQANLAAWIEDRHRLLLKEFHLVFNNCVATNGWEGPFITNGTPAVGHLATNATVDSPPSFRGFGDVEVSEQCTMEAREAEVICPPPTMSGWSRSDSVQAVFHKDSVAATIQAVLHDDEPQDTGPRLTSELTNRRAVLRHIRHCCHACSELKLALAREFEGLRKKPKHEVLCDVVRSQFFELIFTFVILANALALGLSIQYTGVDAGHQLGVAGYNQSAAEEMPGLRGLLDVAELSFLVIFILELTVRVAAYRSRWFSSLWNYMDLFVIIMALVAVAAPEAVVVDPTIVRLVRMSKLLRLVRVLRAQNIMETLHLLMVCLRASFGTLFWSVLILLLVQAIAAMLIAQMVSPYITNEANPIEHRNNVFLYYGTFWRALITMFEVTFANWANACRLLVDNVGEEYGVFFVVYRCIIGFAVLSVIQAVFIQQTMKTAQQDLEFEMQLKMKEAESYKKKLERIFKMLDPAGDGTVTLDQFEPLMSDPQIQLLFSTLDVDAKDVPGLFRALDDGDGKLSSEEFIRGLQHMKGPAKALDMATVSRVVRRIESKVDRMRNAGALTLSARTAIRAAHTSSLSSNPSRMNNGPDNTPRVGNVTTSEWSQMLHNNGGTAPIPPRSGSRTPTNTADWLAI